jgi:hypothetical protein
MVREFASTGSVSLRGFAAVGFAAIAAFLGFIVVMLIAVAVLALWRGLSFFAAVSFFTAVSFFAAMAFSDFALVFELVCEAGREFLSSVGLAT